MIKEEKIKAVLELHRQELIKRGYGKSSILGLFLFGSQNYNLDDENSDVDSIAIIIPNFTDLALQTKLDREIIFDNGEHCKVKTIQQFISLIKNQNLNYMEVLFTNHCIINIDYLLTWSEFCLNLREEISHSDVKKLLFQLYGAANKALKGKNMTKKKIIIAERSIIMAEDILEDDFKMSNIFGMSNMVREAILKYKNDNRISISEKLILEYQDMVEIGFIRTKKFEPKSNISKERRLEIFNTMDNLIIKLCLISFDDFAISNQTQLIDLY